LYFVAFIAVNRSRNVMNLGSRQPVLGKDVFVASNAVVVGDVQLGNQSSVYMGAVLRGNPLKFSLALYKLSFPIV
jgi:carbonic anhydrase/acetyltransferase-like protein (isoleucine patch superfamily)